MLENGELRLAYADGAFFLHYYDTLLPITPNTYGLILERALERLAPDLPADDEQLVELQSILTAIFHLPPTSVTDPARVAEREREKEVVKRRLATLTAEWPELRTGLETSLAELNGQVGQPASFDRLDALLDRQPYRLAFWRVASEEINYRRFFDINQLAAIRVERPEVFRETHRLVLELLRAGHVTGLRIDHPDGLRDPPATSACSRRPTARSGRDEAAAGARGRGAAGGTARHRSTWSSRRSSATARSCRSAGRSTAPPATISVTRSVGSSSTGASVAPSTSSTPASSAGGSTFATWSTVPRR